MRMPLIVTVHHKEPPPVIPNRVFMHMVVGDAIGPDSIMTDTAPAFRNISKKSTFAEMRAHYWVWQNLQPRPYVGFHHYRRAFLIPEFAQSPEIQALAGRTEPTVAIPFVDLYRYNLGLEKLGDEQPAKVLQAFNGLDAIVPPATVVPGGIEENYKSCHRAEDWEVFKTVAPKYGLQMTPGLSDLRSCNCYVLRWPLFLDYMQMWWGITSSLATRLTIDEEGYQHRTIGFLSERIFSYWFAQQKGLKVRECPLLVGT